MSEKSDLDREYGDFLKTPSGKKIFIHMFFSFLFWVGVFLSGLGAGLGFFTRFGQTALAVIMTPGLIMAILSGVGMYISKIPIHFGAKRDCPVCRDGP